MSSGVPRPAICRGPTPRTGRRGGGLPFFPPPAHRLAPGGRGPPRRGATGWSRASMSSAVTRPPICRGPTPFWYHHGGPASGSARKEGRPVTSAAIYARVSSARQKKDQTIGSQTAALRDHARQLGVELPEEWVFEDEGHSGATLVRPALEALRDLAAQGCVDVVLCYSPDRLARKFAYQALLIEEFARAGVRVEFVRGPRGDSPEDQLMVQFQGMFAEYEQAQLVERHRRGKADRPRTADGASIADLARWLTGQGAPTRTGKNRWDRSVVWAMLRTPAYAGTAVFGKTMATSGTPGLNRVARLQGRATPRAARTVDRPREERLEIPVPAIVDQDPFARVRQRLEDNKRFAARNTKVPSLLQGLAACSACGYGYYRTSARTTSRPSRRPG